MSHTNDNISQKRVFSRHANRSSWVLYIFSFLILYFLIRPTNAQLFHKLSRSYMFRHYRVILRHVLVRIYSYPNKEAYLGFIPIEMGWERGAYG